MPVKSKPAKRKLSKQQTAKQYRETMRVNDAARARSRRKVASVLLFWQVCGTKHCLRARACVGDCFERIWRHVPEETKFFVRSFMKASGPGRSRQQIEADVARDKQRWVETQASGTRADAARAQAASSALSPQTPAIVRAAPDAQPNPRLRVL